MIIVGSRSMNNVMGQLQYPCPQCRQNSFHTIVRSKRWFTFFFIPIFPFSKRSISRCNVCGFQTTIDNADADARFAQQVQPPQPQTQLPYQQQHQPYMPQQQQTPQQYPPQYPPQQP